MATKFTASGNLDTDELLWAESAGNTGAAGNMSVSRLVSATGNPLVDGVLSGVAWNSGGQLSYSFPQFAAQYGPGYGAGETGFGFQPANATQTQAVQYVMYLLGQYTPLQIFFINEGVPAAAKIRFANFSGGTNLNAHGYYPDGFGAMGDVWMYSQDVRAATYFSPALGNWGFATFMHEIGHAVGLKHGQDTGIGANPTQQDGTAIPRYAPLPSANDSWNYSLMTYRSYQGAVSDPVQGSVDSDNPTSYMMADIAALQAMYGANYNNDTSGNSTYSWNGSGQTLVNGSVIQAATVGGKVFQTIWDGGGTDLYDTSNYSTNQIIDLRPGEFSTFNAAQLADLDKEAATRPANGNVANALLFNGDPRSLIENATTGAGNDRITGNQIGNILRGGAGNDTLSGLGGNDILDGGADADVGGFSQTRSAYDVRTFVQGGQLKTEVIHIDSEGTDILTSVELLAFTDGTFHNDGANLNHISNASGSRFDDVLIQSGTTGQVLYARMGNGVFQGWNVDTGALGTTWTAVAAGDINPAHAGGAETFVQNSTNGTIYYSSLDTGAVTWGVVSTSLTPDWKLRAVGDINGNGGVDVVIQQASTGTTYYANMTGGTFGGWNTVNTNLTSDWVAVGAADINRDGFADVVIQQQSTGTIYYASMVNGAFGGWGVVNVNLTSDWKARAVGDLNGDGSADVVVQSQSTGTAYYANMAGGAFSGWGVVAQNTGPAWVVQGVADVDNDGYRDVLMQNTGDGTTYYAHMGASGFTNWGAVATNISADWHVV